MITYQKRKQPKIKHMLCLLFLILLLLVLGNSPYKDDRTFIETEYVVESGDTLWGIAKQYRPNDDPREVIWEIREDNNITPLIHPGQLIIIRVEN